MKRYLCTIFNYDYTAEDHEALLDAHYVPAVRLVRIAVIARSGREAAARAYVRTVGRVRARKLRELNAPACCLLPETRWRILARRLGRASNWLGDVFVYDNMVENFYIRVERRSAALQPLARRRARFCWLLRASQLPSAN